MNSCEQKATRKSPVRVPAFIVVLLLTATAAFSQAPRSSRDSAVPHAGGGAHSADLSRDRAAVREHVDLGQSLAYTPAGEKSSYSATWILHALPPVGTLRDTFDETLLDHVVVSICHVAADGSCEPVDELTAEELEIELHDHASCHDECDGDPGYYRFRWAAPGALIGSELKIRFFVAGLHVAEFSYVPISCRERNFYFQINDHPRIWARVLRLQGYDAGQLADLLIEEFDLGSIETVRVLSGEGYAVVAIGDVLLSRFGESAEDAAWLLRGAGFGAEDAGEVLRDVYGLDAYDSGAILRDVGYSCIEISQALGKLFGGNPQATADVLATIDCAPDANCFFPEDDGGGDVRLATGIVDSLSAVMTLQLPHDGHDAYFDEDNSWEDSPADIEFDRSLLPFLSVSIVDPADCWDAGESRVSCGEEPGQIELRHKYYELDWRPDQCQVGKELEIRFAVAGLHLVSKTYFAKNPRMVHIRFRIDPHPVVRARVLHASGLSATEIVTRLIAEFGLDAGAVARILYEEQFTPAELGAALRDGLPAGPGEVAAALHEGTIPSVFALELLDLAFDLTLPEIVSIMRGAGYSASEVFRALDVLFDLNDTEIEALLREGGYSEAEILEALAPRLLAKYACLIARNGPKIYFHPLEGYLPSSIDWFMGVSPLAWGVGDQECDGCRLAPGEVNSSTLVDRVEQIRAESPGQLDFWFDVPEPDENPAARAGDLAGARTYVHAVRLRDIGVTDLQFWLYYPYNGPGSMRPSSDLFSLGNVCAENPNFGNVAPLGEHESDWEVVVLRFDDATNELLEIYLSAHGDYIRYPVNQLDLEGGHVVAYSALNGHAFFPHAGDNPHREVYVSFGIGNFELNTLNWTARGPFLPAWQRYDFVAIDEIFVDAPWLAFDGVWGATVPYNLTDSQKAGIVEAVADDCILAVRLIHIPIAALASCSVAVCPVVCAPAAAFFGIGYGICYAACVPSCTAAVIVAANIAIDPLIDTYGPDIIDGQFPDQAGTGKRTPAARGEEWRHFRLPNELPRIILISDLGDPNASTRQIVVNIPDQVCERKGEKWLLGAPLCVNTPEPDLVELGIDDEYFDITDSGYRLGNGTVFTFDWDTTSVQGPSHYLSPRYADPEGTTFEYTRGFEAWTGAVAVDLQLNLEYAVINEGGTAVLHGAVTPGIAPFQVTIDWADGSDDVMASAADSFDATHPYPDDGIYTISVTIDNGTDMASATTRLVVRNLAPELNDITVSPDGSVMLDIGTTVAASATFSDEGMTDVHTAEWDWGDGTAETQEGVTSPVSASHTYLSPGIHEITLTLSDEDLGADRAYFRWVVVSDPVETAGAGTILAPVAALETGEAIFALEVFTDDQDQTIVDLELTIGGLVFHGVDEPIVVYAGNTVEIEGNVEINGVSAAPNGMPYRIHITATDEPDTFEMRVWYLDQIQGNDVERLVYKTESGQALLSGELSVDEIDGTTGQGSILAPIADDPNLIAWQEADFAFVLLTDAPNDPGVDFYFDVEGFVLRGLQDAEVDVGGNQVWMEGGVTVAGEDTAPNGNPYRIRIMATDGPDTFQLQVWYLDESGVEQVFYETDADQLLISGDVRVRATPISSWSPRDRPLRDASPMRRTRRPEPRQPRGQ